MNLKKRPFCLLLVLLLSLSHLSSCAAADPPPAADRVLLAMLAPSDDASTEAVLDNHRLFARNHASEGDTYLSDTLFSALYGEAARGLLQGDGQDSPAINDAAVCLSVSPTPTEWAVFRCSDARATATAAGIAHARLDAVRRAWAGTEWESLVKDGEVTIKGAYVLLVIAEDPSAALSRAERAIGKRSA